MLNTATQTLRTRKSLTSSLCALSLENLRQLLIRLMPGILILAVLSYAKDSLSQSAKLQAPIYKTIIKQQTYPPYPDVWQWNLKLPDSATFIKLHTLDSGDVLVSYNDKLPSGKWIQKQFTLFGEQEVVQKKSNFELKDGTKLTINPTFGWGNEIVYPDGSKIDGVTESILGCWRGPANNYFEKHNADSQTSIWSKSIFKLLDKPEHFSVSGGRPGNCPEGAYPDLIKQVEAIDFGIFPLMDGTFLVHVDDRLYIRLDKDFHTKAPLLSKQIFILDVDGSLVPPAANPEHFDYANGSQGGRFYYQKALDDLYKYIITLKRGS